MTYGMEFHDARLLELEQSPDGHGFVLFHGCVHRSDGQVFKDPQESGWQNVRFLLEGMRVEGELELDSYAYAGELWVNGKNANGMAMLPAEHSGDVYIQLRSSPNFDLVKIHCTRISSSFEGDFELESTWDAEGNRKDAS